MHNAKIISAKLGCFSQIPQDSFLLDIIQLQAFAKAVSAIRKSCIFCPVHPCMFWKTQPTVVTSSTEILSGSSHKELAVPFSVLHVIHVPFTLSHAGISSPQISAIFLPWDRDHFIFLVALTSRT